jgi:peroxiredoxin Q/BCP
MAPVRSGNAPSARPEKPSGSCGSSVAAAGPHGAKALPGMAAAQQAPSAAEDPLRGLLTTPHTAPIFRRTRYAAIHTTRPRMLSPGDKAPLFELPDSDMRMTKSSDLFGQKNVVMYFYPKDDTPGCTLEALEFSDIMARFEALDTVVVGVSRDPCTSHAAFRDKYGLTVHLLADPEGEVCNAYGVWQEREKNGEKKMSVVRSTFIIDKHGVVRHALYDVKPKGHADTVLGLIEAL